MSAPCKSGMVMLGGQVSGTPVCPESTATLQTSAAACAHACSGQEQGRRQLCGHVEFQNMLKYNIQLLCGLRFPRLGQSGPACPAPPVPSGLRATMSLMKSDRSSCRPLRVVACANPVHWAHPAPSASEVAHAEIKKILPLVDLCAIIGTLIMTRCLATGQTEAKRWIKSGGCHMNLHPFPCGGG